MVGDAGIEPATPPVCSGRRDEDPRRKDARRAAIQPDRQPDNEGHGGSRLPVAQVSRLDPRSKACRASSRRLEGKKGQPKEGRGRRGKRETRRPGKGSGERRQAGLLLLCTLARKAPEWKNTIRASICTNGFPLGAFHHSWGTGCTNGARMKRGHSCRSFVVLDPADELRRKNASRLLAAHRIVVFPDFKKLVLLPRRDDHPASLLVDVRELLMHSVPCRAILRGRGQRIASTVSHAGPELPQNAVEVRFGQPVEERRGHPTLDGLDVVAVRIGGVSILEIDANEAEPSRRRCRRRNVDFGAVYPNERLALNVARSQRRGFGLAHARQGVDAARRGFLRTGSAPSVYVACFGGARLAFMRQ